LFEEIDRLSEHHRSAVVLCDLEGLTHEQAARRLGCPVKTVEGRLYRARELLRLRLTRRGVTTTAGMLGVALAHRTASGAPSASWVDATARAAAQLAAGQGEERFLSAESAAFYRHVLRAMTMSKSKIAGLWGLALAATAVGMAIGWARRDNSQVQDQPPPNAGAPGAGAAALDPAEAQRQAFQSLKVLGVAMYNYQESHGRFPAAAIQGPEGKPLLSWHVALLPYIDENELYQSFKLDEPWDSPHNKPLLEKMPLVFAPPHPPGPAQGSVTHYRVFVGAGTPFEGGRGPRLEDFSDGRDRTILITEADEAVPWTKPDDLSYDPNKPLPPLGGGPRGSFLILMADGSVRSIPTDIDPALLRQAITRNDKQPVDLKRLGAGQPLPPPPGQKGGQDGKRSETTRPGDRGAGQGSTPKSVDRIVLSGRVLDPDGKLLAGAAVYFVRPEPFVWVPHPRPLRRPEPSATSGPDGRFQILVDRMQWDDVGQQPRTFGRRDPCYPIVVAVVPGYGPGWVPLERPESRADVTVQVVRDDVPIEGRILDLEGRPVPGATVATDDIMATPGEDLTPVIRSGGRGEVPVKFLAASVAGMPATLTTDRDGRFHLTGMGRERAVPLRISGPTIRTSHVFVMTRLDLSAFQVRFERPKLPIADSPSIGGGPTVYGARFEHAVGPTKPIEGVVRNCASGRPLPGAVIVTVAVWERNGNREGWGDLGGGSATADAQGRFRLTGASKSRDLGVLVLPPEGQPYLERMERVGDTPGLAPIVHDVSLTRGIPVHGRLVDRESGRPVRAVVAYFLLDINPKYGELRNSLALCRAPTDDDGSFSIVALDGPGLLGVSAYSSERFTRSVGVDRFKLAKPSYNQYIATPANAEPKSYDALVELDLPAGSNGVERTIELIPSK
jgi:protocatechuate 3,4-dioxygenase beta subunit